jgi:hypothetical protein
MTTATNKKTLFIPNTPSCKTYKIETVFTETISSDILYILSKQENPPAAGPGGAAA